MRLYEAQFGTAKIVITENYYEYLITKKKKYKNNEIELHYTEFKIKE